MDRICGRGLGGASGLVLVLAAAAPGAALAQPASTAQLEEIVVTAQKRAESMQDVPASISVVTGERLEAMGVTSLTQYAAYTPGLSVDTLGNPGEARVTLRGIAPIGSGSAVGAYLDDVPVGSSTTHSGGSQLALDLMPYDLERLEVLRGPQGTLYGASTMGGLLKYVTVSPDLGSREVRAGVEATTIKGTGDVGRALRASLNVPLVEDRLAVRVSLFDQRTPGYIDNPALGRDVNDVRQSGGRVALLWAPADSVQVKLQALIQDIDTDDSAVVWRDVDFQPLAGDLGALYQRPQPFKQRQEVYSATLSWDLGWAELVSASSYQEARHNVGFDQTFAWADYFPLLDSAVAPGASRVFQIIGTKKHTQEVRLASPSGKRVEWLVGGFYTRERSTIEQIGTAETPAGAPIASLSPFFSVLQHDAYDEYAAFGNLTVRLTDRFDVTGGLRWSHNKQRFDEVVDGVFANLILPAPPPQATAGRSSEDVTTYMVSARYHLSDDAMLYGRIARGYRPGGPNVGVAGVPPQVDADTLVNYELGLKATLLDGRAQVDLAAFYIDWSGIQINVTDPATSISYSANAGSAESQGVEFSASLKPVPPLLLGLNLAYTDAKLTSELPPNAPPQLGWRSGDRLPYAPKWNASLTAAYDVALPGDWSANVGGGVRYVGARLSDPESYPLAVRSGDYLVLDLNAQLARGPWVLHAFVRNLTDERAYLSAGQLTHPLTQAPHHIEATILAPRTVGLGLDVRF